MRPDEVGGMINLDFDGEGRILGLEVLEASKHLPARVLNQAEQLSERVL